MIQGNDKSLERSPPLPCSEQRGREELFRERAAYQFFHLRRANLPLAESRQRALRNPGPRTWTIAPPPGWETARSLDEVLDHRDFLRACDEAWEQARSGPEDRLPLEKRSDRPE